MKLAWLYCKTLLQIKTNKYVKVGESGQTKELSRLRRCSVRASTQVALEWGHAIALYEGAGWEVGELMESRDRGSEIQALSEQVTVTETVNGIRTNPGTFPSQETC